jgi:hypothetical protein
MRILLFSVIFQIGLCLGLLGQDTLTRWFPVGAKWWYGETYRYPTDPKRAWEIEIVADTLIHPDYECKVRVRKRYDSNLNIVASGSDIVCQKGNKIYDYPTDCTPPQMRLLYDFDAQPGDTVFVNDCWCDNFYVIDSVKIQNFNGKDLRVQYTSDLMMTICEMIFNDVIYEKIGGRGFIYPESGFYQFNTPAFLRCYEDSEIGLINFTHDRGECLYFPVSRSPASFSSPVRAYPNPAGDKLHVEHPLGSSLALYDASGRRFLRQKTLGERTEWDVSHWPRGLYFLRVSDGQGREYTQKISLE